MIHVEKLTKKYGGVTAIDKLSFNINRGEVVGFLGPNGAGKTTTMRILSGFLPASSGAAIVAGRDVYSDPLGVKKKIGYLPENCPLHLDMKVREYLKFRARLKGIYGKRRRERMRYVIKRFGLHEVRNRIIGQLSKGYKQRVGLADAVLHEPELLILDEPTLGLDPNQIREVRSLILELAKTQTILLSTHILSEVEMTCDRVIIINKGKIIAEDTTWALKEKLSQGARVYAEVKADQEEVLQQFKKLPGVTNIKTDVHEEWVQVELESDSQTDIREELYREVSRNNWSLRELHQEQHSLEDVFVKLTNDSGDDPV